MYQSDESSEEEDYAIYDLIEYKQERGKEYLLVWWEGYPKEEATWEPTSNLQSIPDFYQSYSTLKQSFLQKKSKRGIRGAKLQKKRTSKIALKSKNIEQQIFQQESQQQIQILPKNNGFRYVNLAEKNQDRLKKGLKKYETKNTILNEDEKSKAKFQKSPVVLQQQSSNSSMTPLNIKEVYQVDKKKMSMQSKILNDLSTENEQIVAIEPIRFNIKVKESTKLMFHNEQLAAIKDVCLKNNEVLYLVEFNNSTFKEPIYLHEKYLKLLWPRKFAQFLLSKVRL